MLRFVIALLLVIGSSCVEAETMLEIKPANSGTNVPCCVKLPRDKHPDSVCLVDDSGAKIPCQWGEKAADGTAMLRWIEKSVQKDKVLTRKLVSCDPAPTAVEIKKGEGKLDVLIGGKLFTSYNYSDKDPKPYCWPVMAPTGKPITRAYPMIKDVPGEQHDHHHHRSWYFTYGSVNGTCFWSETNKSGFTRHAKLERVTSGPVFGEIVARNNWVTKEGKKEMEDVRLYRFYNVPDQFLVDWDVCLLATDGPVKMGDTKEGMASFRVATSMIQKNGGKVTNSEGHVDGKCWGKQAAWCDVSGTVEGATVGVALFDHPTSFRHPTYWHARTYGLFGANPFGLSYFLRDKKKDGSHTIPADGELSFKYRVYIHNGAAAQAHVAEKYANFATPPTVTAKTQ